MSRRPSCHHQACAAAALISMLAVMIAPVLAQAASSAAPNTPAAVVSATAAAPKPAAKPRECTRLPLTDIQAGQDKTIEVARIRLGEYADKVAKKKGWKTWDKSLETVSCAEYLWVPIIGQEYKCLITATFCKRS